MAGSAATMCCGDLFGGHRLGIDGGLARDAVSKALSAVIMVGSALIAVPPITRALTASSPNRCAGRRGAIDDRLVPTPCADGGDERVHRFDRGDDDGCVRAVRRAGKARAGRLGQGR